MAVCEIVTATPPIVIDVERAAGPAFGATLNTTCPAPAPWVFDTTATQLAPPVTDHGQPCPADMVAGPGPRAAEGPPAAGVVVGGGGPPGRERETTPGVTGIAETV